MDTWELYLRIGVAVLAGTAVGLERELRGHPAGMRTHTLVAVGAALFTLAGAHGFAEIAHGPNIDPARVAAQVASGIGFIGAGAIIRDGAGVRGITTASTLWLSGALGVSAGAGMYSETILGTTAILVVLTGLRMLKPSLQRFSRAQVSITVEYEAGHGTLGPLIRGINDRGAQLSELIIDDDPTERRGLSGADLTQTRRVTLRVGTRVTAPCGSSPTRSSVDRRSEHFDSGSTSTERRKTSRRRGRGWSSHHPLPRSASCWAFSTPQPLGCLDCRG